MAEVRGAVCAVVRQEIQNERNAIGDKLRAKIEDCTWVGKVLRTSRRPLIGSMLAFVAS